MRLVTPFVVRGGRDADQTAPSCQRRRRGPIITADISALPTLTGCLLELRHPANVTLKRGLVSAALPPRGIPSNWDER